MEKEKNGIGRILIVVIIIILFVLGSVSSLYFYLGFLKDSNNVIIKQTMIGYSGYKFNMPNDIYFIQKENMIELTDNNSWYGSFQIINNNINIEQIDFNNIFKDKEITIKENKTISNNNYYIIEVKDIDESGKEIGILYAYANLNENEIIQIYGTTIDFEKPSYEALNKIAKIISSKDDTKHTNVDVEINFPNLNEEILPDIKESELIKTFRPILIP